MKKITVLFFTTLWFSSAAAQEFTDEVDRFTGERNIKFSDAPSLSAPNLSSYITVKSSETSFFSIISIFSSTRRGGSSWRYLGCHTTHWLLDGAPFSMAPVRHQGSVLRGGVVESLVQTMTHEQMRAVAQAQVVEYKICNDEYKLTAAQLNGLRQVVNAFEGRDLNP